MNKTLAYFLARLREPSTMAGLSCVAVVVGLPPGTVEVGTTILGAVAGLAAILLPDAK